MPFKFTDTVAAEQRDERLFLKEVADHEMTVLQDDGVFRHLSFRKPGTSFYSFQITTFPGHLAITGDMGTFVFQRLTDMFKFFRMPSERPEYLTRRGLTLDINKSYWAEKIVAGPNGSSSRGATGFDEDKFTRHVMEYLVAWVRDWKANGVDKAERRELWERVVEEVIQDGSSSEQDAHEAAQDFKATVDGDTYTFDDSWEWDLRDYTTPFCWCARAIVWGIQRYDAHRDALKAANDQTTAAVA